jgi:Protein of unknown function (DUF1493)
MTTTLAELSALLAEIRREPLHRITPTTRLGEDLGIDGDDWDEVLLAIVARWQTDFTGFDFYDYFGEEPSFHSLIVVIKDLWTGKRLKPLTVSHLAAVIDRGSWFEPGQASA